VDVTVVVVVLVRLFRPILPGYVGSPWPGQARAQTEQAKTQREERQRYHLV
jgi:hypothetical protein